MIHDAAHDRLDVPWIGEHHHRGRHAHREVHRGGHPEGVKQREGRQHDFVAPLGSREPGSGLLKVGSEIGVREHRPLGDAGRAAGVLEHREVVRRRPRLQWLWRSAPDQLPKEMDSGLRYHPCDTGRVGTAELEPRKDVHGEPHVLGN